ncbi:LytR/AlgR family response regulator transcription factor [Sunxiuqinia sp. A32]|uniref:LytR/AlgR family response regulator transcription factor n=1 Tax=Sunxiuqinia sp. A32 TaxID=3461496 RepID=UPI004046608E
MKKLRLKALVVDDEKADRDLLCYLLKSNSGIGEIHEAGNVEDALFKFIDISPDIVFLDIVMPGKSGLDFIELIKKRNLATNIIIVSAYKDSAIEAIRSQVYDFILKPINEKDLSSLIEKYRVHKNMNINEKLDKVLNNIDNGLKLKISSKNSHILIDPNDILYCAAEGSYTDIHLTNGSIELANTYLAKVEKMLEDFRFFRIGRSTLINLDKLWKVNRNDNSCVLSALEKNVKLRGSAKQIKLLCEMNLK